MTRPAALSPYAPIPFTLTPRALAALRDPAPISDGPEPGEWACQQCGAAWFGTPPDDGLCPNCRPDGGAG